MAPADMHNNVAGGGLAASYAYPTTAGQQQQQGGNPAPAYTSPVYPPQPMDAGNSTVGPQAAQKPPTGYPVSGAPASPDVYPPQDSAHPKSGHAPGIKTQQALGGREPCTCSAGWVLFGIGFFFTPCWIAALFVPCCTKKRNDRRAAIASAVWLAVVIIVAIILGATSSKWRSPQSYASYTLNGHTYYYSNNN